jgi:hypothetical protein
MNKQEFMRLAEQVADVVAKKSEDYQGKETSLGSYFPFHHYSHVQMIWTKTLRLMTLTKRREDGSKPNFESVDDTVLDLVAYCIFYRAFLETRHDTDNLGE